MFLTGVHLIFNVNTFCSLFEGVNVMAMLADATSRLMLTMRENLFVAVNTIHLAKIVRNAVPCTIPVLGLEPQKTMHMNVRVSFLGQLQQSD